MNSRKLRRLQWRLVACLFLCSAGTAQSAQDSPPRDTPGITEPLLAPVIVTHPLDAVLSLGENADFKVEALGAKHLYFQWRRDGTKLEGQIAETLKVRKATALDAGAYTVVVSNSFGAVTSRVATLTVLVLVPPAIITQPLSQSVTPGGTLILSVVVSGTGPFRYQWTKNDSNLLDATNPILTIPNFQAGDSGNYRVLVESAAGSARSEIAAVTAAVIEVSFADAIGNSAVLPSDNGTARGSNRQSTRESNEPDHAGERGGKSVWVRYRPTASGIARFTTAGSTLDTLLAVYTGDSLVSLKKIASDDDGDKDYAMVRVPGRGHRHLGDRHQRQRVRYCAGSLHRVGRRLRHADSRRVR